MIVFNAVAPSNPFYRIEMMNYLPGTPYAQKYLILWHLEHDKCVGTLLLDTEDQAREFIERLGTYTEVNDDTRTT